MNRKKLTNLFLLSILLFGNASAQKAKPNFSGVWNLDKRETTMFLEGQEMLGLAQYIVNCSIKMSIEHNEPELSVKQNSICGDLNKPNKTLETTETVSKYFTDGRGEVNTTSKNETVESKTEWKDDKIIIKTFQTNAKNGKKKTISIRELDISKDNQKLIVKSDRNNKDFASSYTKMVFRISK